MGYYTTFSITTTKNNETNDLTQEMKDALVEITEPFGFDKGDVDDLSEGALNAKWYNFQEHVTELSRKFPDHIFTLAGYGEEQDDIWKAYFKDGKFQMAQAEIVFPEYDETLLT